MAHFKKAERCDSLFWAQEEIRKELQLSIEEKDRLVKNVEDL